MTRSPDASTPARRPDPRPVVHHDGSCPLCRAEIGLYQRLGAQADFVDVSDGTGAPEGVSCSDAMKRFHVTEVDGTVRSGAAAFAALWRATPGWRTLGRIAGTRPIVWILEGLYRVFLLIRPAFQALARRLERKRA